MAEIDYPDWMTPTVLIGQDVDGNPVVVRVDENGRLTVPIMGENPDSEMVPIAVDALGQIFAVMKGRDDNVLAIDSDGFMSAILKGDYEGALRTIGLDDDGRISGYLVDKEDQWGEIIKVGQAEQAARLGSPVTWDRRGQVQRVIDFSTGFQGLQRSVYAGDSAISLNPEYQQTGGYSALLHTGAAASCYAYLGGRLGGTPENRYGLSVLWASAASPDFLYIGIKHYRGTVKQEARLLFDDGAEKLQYFDSDGNYQDIDDVVLSASDYSFHNMKLVVDFDTGLYVRALVDSTQYDLSAAVKTSSVPAGAEYSLYRFHVDGYDAITSDTYLDSMVFTVNEP